MGGGGGGLEDGGVVVKTSEGVSIDPVNPKY